MNTSSCSDLPFLQEWKLRNHRMKSEPKIVKFEVISRQSMPYLKCSKSVHNPVSQKLFRKAGTRQHLIIRKMNSVQLHGWGKKSQKIQITLNKYNYEKHRLRIQLQNLRINTIMERSSQDLIQRQNMMLNQMI